MGGIKVCFRALVFNGAGGLPGEVCRCQDTFLVATLGEKGAVSILWVEAVLGTAPHADRCRPDVPVGRLRTVHGWEGGTGPAERVFLGRGGKGWIGWLVDSRPCPIRAHRGAHCCEGGQGSADRGAFCCELGRKGVRPGRLAGCRPRRWDRVCEGPLHAQEPGRDASSPGDKPEAALTARLELRQEPRGREGACRAVPTGTTGPPRSTGLFLPVLEAGSLWSRSGRGWFLLNLSPWSVDGCPLLCLHGVVPLGVSVS